MTISTFLFDLDTVLGNVSPGSLILTLLTLAAISLLGYVLITELYRYKVRLRSIPGPVGLPVVGNLYQLGPDPAETLHQWVGKINRSTSELQRNAR